MWQFQIPNFVVIIKFSTFAIWGEFVGTCAKNAIFRLNFKDVLQEPGMSKIIIESFFVHYLKLELYTSYIVGTIFHVFLCNDDIL